MRYLFSFLLWIVVQGRSFSQELDGVYVGLELNSLQIDTSGKIYFYGIENFQAEKHFHEVKITVSGKNITISKYPVYFDSLGKTHSASDGGFLTYKGDIAGSDGYYVAVTQLVDFDYIGFSTYTPPGGDSSKMRSPEELKKEFDHMEWMGRTVYFPKGTVHRDYVIKKDREGIWLNNIFYNRLK